MKYTGNCHCKTISFELDIEPITGALQCNCSICIRKNAIMSVEYFTPEHFTQLKGLENLTCYHWNDCDVNHYFCKTCGIYPFHDSIDAPGKFRINLGCINEIDPRGLTIKQFDGRNKL
jgi:hypothetical protein